MAPDRTGPRATDFAALRASEFARLDVQDCTYLDYTGAALYPESLVTSHTEFLRGRVLGNPHAESPVSLAATGWITAVRERVLRFLDADPAEYAVCFTANATAAVGLVAAAYRFGIRCAARVVCRQSQLGKRHSRIRPAVWRGGSHLAARC